MKLEINNTFCVNSKYVPQWNLRCGYFSNICIYAILVIFRRHLFLISWGMLPKKKRKEKFIRNPCLDALETWEITACTYSRFGWNKISVTKNIEASSVAPVIKFHLSWLSSGKVGCVSHATLCRPTDKLDGYSYI